MITGNVLQRVLRMQCGTEAGSSFTIERNGVQYLVTAKHLFEKQNYPRVTEIKLLIDGIYQKFEVEIKYPLDNKIDIAVLKTNPYCELTPKFNTRVSSEGVILGQEVYFLGFPFDYERLLVNYPNSNSPVPFVKKATMSGMLTPAPSLMVLDGYNNPGFSGGPVCFKRENDGEFSIAGVVSGYRFGRSPVFEKGSEKELDYFVKENAGIVNAYDISFAVQIADEWDEE